MAGHKRLRQRINPACHRFRISLRNHLLVQFRDKTNCKIKSFGLYCMVDGLFKVVSSIQKFSSMTMKGVEARLILTKEFPAENLTQHRLTYIGQVLLLST